MIKMLKLIKHYPTLNTVIMVENTLKNMDESVITIADLKRKLPKQINPYEDKIKYEANNLVRVELPNFWRMLYTLTEGESQIEIIAFVLNVLNHKDYNKKFGYK